MEKVRVVGPLERWLVSTTTRKMSVRAGAVSGSVRPRTLEHVEWCMLIIEPV